MSARPATGWLLITFVLTVAGRPDGCDRGRRGARGRAVRASVMAEGAAADAERLIVEDEDDFAPGAARSYDRRRDPPWRPRASRCAGRSSASPTWRHLDRIGRRQAVRAGAARCGDRCDRASARCAASLIAAGATAPGAPCSRSACSPRCRALSRAHGREVPRDGVALPDSLDSRSAQPRAAGETARSHLPLLTLDPAATRGASVSIELAGGETTLNVAVRDP